VKETERERDKEETVSQSENEEEEKPGQLHFYFVFIADKTETIGNLLFLFIIRDNRHDFKELIICQLNLRLPMVKKEVIYFSGVLRCVEYDKLMQF